MAVKVITDSTSYLPRSIRKSLDLSVVALSSMLDGITYSDDAEDYAPFFTALQHSKAFPTTSQPAVHDIADVMEKHVAAGNDVVGVFISEHMSGTYATALLARDIVRERYPEATIEVVDGRSNSMELGLAATAAATAAAAGAIAAHVVEAARDMIDRTRFLFVPDSFEYLHRGGRIGRASALVGTVLKIHPILTVRNGVTEVFEKVRAKQRAFEEIVNTCVRDIQQKGGLDQVIVHHINDEAAGRRLAAMVETVVGRSVDICPIGPVVGAHVGPGAVGLVYSTFGPMMKNA